MQIDVIIDVVCPWCYVGKKQLDRAVAERRDVVKEVRYRPFQLDATTPQGGVDRRTHYRKKFGDSPQLAVMRQHLNSLAQDLEITFDFESDCLIANTIDAHRLIRWAGSAEAFVPGTQDRVVDALMKAYFEECAFLGDHALLADIGAFAGMDHSLIAELLETDQDADLIRADIQKAKAMGVQGVPFYVFNGKAAVTGAQDSETLTAVIDRLKDA